LFYQTEVEYPNEGIVQYKYTPEGYLGYIYTYDLQGRAITVIGPDGRILETNIYDENGEKQQALDGTGSGIHYTYDFGGRPITIQTKGGAKQDYQYDPRGNITGILDGNNNPTEYTLDKWGRITGIKKADGTQESYTYDHAGNITSSTDGAGHTTKYHYNAIGKISKIIDPMGGEETYHYDLEERLSHKQDRNGNQIHYQYNLYGAPLSKEEKNSGLRESYTYTKEGLLKTALSEGMHYTYDYDLEGRIISKSASGKKLLSYGYDLSGNKIKQTDITGKTTRYKYNALDLLTEIYDNETKQARYTYNPDGTIKTLENGIIETNYTYDIDKNLTGLKITLGEEIIVNNHYGYDGNGNRTQKQQLEGMTQYHYDPLNRLKQVDYPSYTEKLYYDKTGNRSTRLAKGIEEHYNYDPRNRLITYTKAGQTVAFDYDHAGNLLKDDKATYSYDGFNRMVQAETFDGQIQVNRYDAEGLRYEMEENHELVQFIYSGREIVVEKTETDTLRLIRGYDLILSDSESAKTYYHYAADEMGSTTHITDEEGKILNHYQYDAFGNITEEKETIKNRIKYAGQQYDPITEQYYLRARYYNPVIARFTQEDVYRGDGLNLYAYCSNNPVGYYDPSGYEKNPIKNNQNQTQTPKEVQQQTSPDKNLTGNGESPVAIKPKDTPSQFTPDQRALIDLTKEAKRNGPIEIEDRNILLKWADEYNVKLNIPKNLLRMNLQFFAAKGDGSSTEGGGNSKLTGQDIQFSDKFSKPAYKNQVSKRGWTNESIAETINNPVKTGNSINTHTGNTVTLYYKSDVHYVAIDNGTGKVIQVADLFKENWVLDLTK
jgi:RHS repeat-associated protein